MDRRDFVKTMLVSTGAMMAGSQFYCQSDEKINDLFSTGTRPEKLFFMDIPQKTDWHTKVSLACFQGLINRKETRLYLNNFKADMFWLEYYSKQYEIEYQAVTDIEYLVEMFGHEIEGYIVYDPEMPHSLNIATSMGALQNAVPVSKNLAGSVSDLGIKKIDDLSGKWKDLYEAYEWALTNLQPQCNQKLMAHLCVHDPYWPTSSWTNRDYVIAHKILSVDISSSERDKRDYQLLKKFYEVYPEETVIFGWHCVRDKEHEAIGLSSEYGHYGMCSLHTSNLTVHSSIQPEEKTTYKQRTIYKKDLKVENKVYVAFMATDGDAAWFVQDLISKDWASPVHGKFKYNWGFLPMAYDLLPSMVDYYFKNLKSTDYFVAGPAGATYTYPYLHPNPKKFLRLSQYYMDKCGLNTVHMTNWNDRDWWQEVDLPHFPALLRETMPNCIGYTRGMGESAFERHYISGGKPYIFCGEGLHRGDDIYKVMTDFIEACPNRPLFVYNLVNHTMPIAETKAAMDRFPKDLVEIVHLDELLLLIEKAFEEGKITEDLYPEKAGLKKLLARDAKNAWPAFYKEIAGTRAQYIKGRESYIQEIKKTSIGLEEINPGDFLGFATIWQAMKMVKLALESKGIYVNHKPTANKRFVTEFKSVSDVNFVLELQEQWDNWHNRKFDFENVQKYAGRLFTMVTNLNKIYFN